MANSWMPLLRQAAALARRFLCTVPMRLAIIAGRRMKKMNGRNEKV